MKNSILVIRVLIICLLALLMVAADLFIFRGMVLAAIMLVISMIYLPILAARGFWRRFLKLMLFFAAVTTLDFFGGLIIDNELVSAAQHFRVAIISNQSVRRSEIKPIKKYLGYPMRYFSINGSQGGIQIILFNYRRQTLDIETGVISAPANDD